MEETNLELRNIRKVFPGTVAVKDFTTSFVCGKVNALIGKNGAGKSTVVNIISGLFVPTEGTMLINGSPLVLKHPMEAVQNGIATVHQELSIIPSMSVGENIFLGRWPRRKNGTIDWKSLRGKAQKLLEFFDIKTFNVRTPASELSVGQKQIVEILKAMSIEPRVLLLDEPTSSLASDEVNHLFDIVRKLKATGAVIIYITHRLQELADIADTVTVIRDGEFIGTEAMEDLQKEDIVRMMFGSVKIPDHKGDETWDPEVVLTVDNLCNPPYFNNISFELHKGEILGIAGMLGSGRTELLRSLYGLDSFHSGEVVIGDQKIANPTPVKMKSLGLAFASEDRKEEGITLDHPIHTNLVSAALEKIANVFFITREKERPHVEKQIKDLEIKVSDASHPVSSLSGGNQQKVVVGNWLNNSPSILIFDEPSRGIDVAAKQQIFQIMWEEKRNGNASIMVSTELEELLEVCDRILIMRKGRIEESFRPDELTVEQIYTECM